MINPFEHAVADALWDALGTSPVPQSSSPSYVGAVRALAPRVAAAIEAALPLGANIAGWNEMRDQFKTAALAALRGAVRAPAETPE